MHKQELSPPRRRLIEQCQRINFGRLENLVVRRGEPVFDPPPRVVREIRFGAENGPRPETRKPDFILKTEVRDLFAQLEALGNGVVARLDIQRGLPFRMTVEEVCA